MSDPSRYRPHGLTAQAVDPDQCRASVSGQFNIYQCQRKAVVAGEWCRQHQPGAQAKRDDRRRAAYEKEVHAREEREVRRGLRTATLKQLRAELARRGAS